MACFVILTDNISKLSRDVKNREILYDNQRIKFNWNPLLGLRLQIFADQSYYLFIIINYYF